MSQCTVCGHGGEGGGAQTAECREVNRLAELLWLAWAKAEPEHSITWFPTSYHTTFADMAKAIVADRAEAARTASLRSGLRVMDIAWQAFQAGAAAAPAGDSIAFQRWWALRVGQGCAMPTCEKCGREKCGHEASA